MALNCKPPSPYNFEETVSIKLTASNNEEPTLLSHHTTHKTDSHNTDDALRTQQNQAAIKHFLDDDMGLHPWIQPYHVKPQKSPVNDHKNDTLQVQRNQAAFEQFLTDEIGLCPWIELETISEH